MNFRVAFGGFGFCEKIAGTVEKDVSLDVD